MEPSLGLKRKTHDGEAANSNYKRAKILLDDASSDEDSSSAGGGVAVVERKSHLDEPKLRINEDYARKFEHNKKREEIQRCECSLS